MTAPAPGHVRAWKAALADGRCFYSAGAPVRYEVGQLVTIEHPDPAAVGECGRGLHVAPTVRRALRWAADLSEGRPWALFEVDVPEASIIVRGEAKWRVGAVRVVRRVEESELFGPFDQADVDALVADVKGIRWFRPAAEVDHALLEQLVAQHLFELGTYTSDSAQFDGVTLKVISSDPAAARDAARDAAWDAARAAAWAAARAAAWDAAWDAARDAARAAAWAAARAAARDAARDAAWDAASIVSGLPHNPWAPLMEIWAMGCWPIGIVDGEFVVFVPPVAP